MNYEIEFIKDVLRGKVTCGDFIVRVGRYAKNISGHFPMFVATHVLGPFFWRRGIVFLTWYYSSTNKIGEMAHQFDLYVKMEMLGWGPSAKGIIIARNGISNPCLLKYWKRYIRVIDHPLFTRCLFLLAAFVQYNTAIIKMPDGEIVHKNRAIVEVQKQWEKERRQPLLVLSSSHHERGWDCLEHLGVPRGAWFVCLHVREDGFLKGKDVATANAYRDADINTYLLAVKTIVESGGWVIRMGDPTMKPLPSMRHVIDYTRSEARSDWMDIFCCAECRFFLGSTSGLFLVSFDFGVPCALANYTPLGEFPWSEKDIFIPKLYWSSIEGHYLTFKEALAPQLKYCYDGRLFDSSNIKVIDNTQEEINDLVLEMLGRLKGNLDYTEEDNCQQKKYSRLLSSTKYGMNCRIGKEFLRKYTWLLPDFNNKENGM